MQSLFTQTCAMKGGERAGTRHAHGHKSNHNSELPASSSLNLLLPPHI